MGTAESKGSDGGHGRILMLGLDGAGTLYRATFFFSVLQRVYRESFVVMMMMMVVVVVVVIVLCRCFLVFVLEFDVPRGAIVLDL
jgi:hypothetical protein